MQTVFWNYFGLIQSQNSHIIGDGGWTDIQQMFFKHCKWSGEPRQWQGDLGPVTYPVRRASEQPDCLGMQEKKQAVL